MDLQQLREPFKAEDVEWRIGRDGTKKDGNIWAMALCYVTNRAIMDRLDDVCGPGMWKNHYEKAPDGGILCGISIKIEDEWVTKWDGAASTQIEAVKGGLSGAMKRAGVQWGIGRYLYNLESTFVKINAGGQNSGCHIAKDKKRTYYKWDTPQLPAWALPPIEDLTDNKPDLVYKLNVLLDEKDLTDNEKIQISKFYCEAIKEPVVEIADMNEGMLTDFIEKVDGVFQAFLDNIK
ncbi:MAG: recombinase [Desulfobacterales bacterium]|nr:recombinase [Desulfobacterales bacterium]